MSTLCRLGKQQCQNNFRYGQLVHQKSLTSCLARRLGAAAAAVASSESESCLRRLPPAPLPSSSTAVHPLPSSPIPMYRTAREACAFLASFPRAVDAATLGFDVTASLRDQCDALACDDIGTNAADPSNTTETALVDALRARRSTKRDERDAATFIRRVARVDDGRPAIRAVIRLRRRHRRDGGVAPAGVQRRVRGV